MIRNPSCMHGAEGLIWELFSPDATFVHILPETAWQHVNQSMGWFCKASKPIFVESTNLAILGENIPMQFPSFPWPLHFSRPFILECSLNLPESVHVQHDTPSFCAKTLTLTKGFLTCRVCLGSMFFLWANGLRMCYCTMEMPKSWLPGIKMPFSES